MTREKAYEKFVKTLLLDINNDFINKCKYKDLLVKCFDDFESRTCENCKYFMWNDKYMSDYGTCEKSVGIPFHGYNECDKDFGCNEFERLNNEKEQI